MFHSRRSGLGIGIPLLRHKLTKVSFLGVAMLDLRAKSSTCSSLSTYVQKYSKSIKYQQIERNLGTKTGPGRYPI